MISQFYLIKNWISKIFAKSKIFNLTFVGKEEKHFYLKGRSLTQIQIF